MTAPHHPTAPIYGPPHPLTIIRSQRGYTYIGLARAVARAARRFGVRGMAAERQKVWRWEHRGVVPDRISQLALAAELGVPADQVDIGQWPHWLGAAIRRAPAEVSDDAVEAARRVIVAHDEIDPGDTAMRAALAGFVNTLASPTAPISTEGTDDPWAGTNLEAMYGGAEAPRCATCRRPYSQAEARAGMTTCEHCPPPTRDAVETTVPDGDECSPGCTCRAGWTEPGQ